MLGDWLELVGHMFEIYGEPITTALLKPWRKFAKGPEGAEYFSPRRKPWVRRKNDQSPGGAAETESK